MSIMKVTNKTSKYYGMWRVRAQPRDSTGKTISLPVKYVQGTKTDAKRVYAQLIADFNNEASYYSEKKMLFVSAYKAFLESEHRDGRWEEDTYKDHLYSLRVAEKYFSNIKLYQVNENVMRRFAHKYAKDRQLTIARGTVLSRRLEHYRSFFRELIGTVYSRNPVPTRAISKWFTKGEIHAKPMRFVLTRDEINGLKQLIYEKLKKATVQNSVSLIGCLIALETGCRPQEIQALQWNNLVVDGENDQFKVFRLVDSWNEDLRKLNGHLKSRNNGETRNTLPLSESTINVLREFQNRQKQLLERYNITNHYDYVMLNLRDFKLASEGKVISQKSLNEMIKRLCKSLGIGSKNRISMYTCRHSVATLMSAMGVNSAFAASRLGHSIAEYERTYLHEPRDIKDDLMRKWLKG